MTDLNHTALQSHDIGAVPLLEAVIDRLNLEEVLTAQLPTKRRGRKPELPPARTLRVMISNVIVSRLPLYAVPQWLARFVPEHFGLEEGQERLFNDDRIGRTLDLLFDAEQAPLITAVVLKGLRVFDISMSQLHNDSTTVTVCGDYHGQSEQNNTPKITFGFNKDPFQVIIGHRLKRAYFDHGPLTRNDVFNAQRGNDDLSKLAFHQFAEQTFLDKFMICIMQFIGCL